MKTYKVGELEGAMLDAAVAKAEGLPFIVDSTDDEHWVMAAHPGYSGPEDLGRRRVDRKQFSPSTDWAQGGPIIERERIGIEPFGGAQGGWLARHPELSVYLKEYGTTPLIAAMRAYVASELGEEIELGDHAVIG
jgi:hypothetical protein